MIRLPSRAPGLLLAFLLGLFAAAGARAEGSPPLETLFGGPFSLTDHNGEPRSDRDFRGRYMLVYFGYTYCPSICPANLHHMAMALKALGNRADRVVPVFITVDPARDTARVLKDYVEYFDPRFVGLTGTEAEVAAVARAYRVHRRKIVPAGMAPEDYLVDHGSTTYLLGPHGRFRTLFPHDTPGEVMAARIVRYLDAPGS